MAQTHSLFTLANGLTLLRVLLIPVVYLLFELQHYTAALGLLTLSLLSDFLDGWAARTFQQESDLGALLDPVADKLVVLSYFLFLATSSKLLPLWFTLLVCTRNISQLMSIPILSWWLKIRFKVKPKKLPKWGTALSFIIIGATFLILSLQAVEGRLALSKILIHGLHTLLIPLSAALEAYILATFLPRFVHIARGTHDTFE